MKVRKNYRQRAMECLAFANNARTDEERSDLLVMAGTLERLAVKKGQKAEKALPAEPPRAL